jgi:hypothetical protein
MAVKFAHALAENGGRHGGSENPGGFRLTRIGWSSIISVHIRIHVMRAGFEAGMET